MRVVLVDPSRTTVMYISRLLEARQHEVHVFADGREALAYMKSDPEVDALITSAEPLSMSGLELCWETRLIADAYRPIYVILMSATKGDHKLIEALDTGADDFIAKPLVPEELYARLRAAERVAKLHRELGRLATTDALTGVFNRRAFFDKARELCLRAEGGCALSAIMVDVDHFKRVNDAHGHDIGDEVICAVAHELVVGHAVVGRLGGEEFAVLVDRGMSDALGVAERLRAQIGALRIGAAAVTMTCSFGVSTWRRGDTIDALLKRADVALYEAKVTGRDRVVAADETVVATAYSDAGRPIRAGSGRKSA